MKRLEVLILTLVLLGGFLVRLYRFDNPVADWHSFRQSDTNAVSVIYVRDGINLLYPRYFDISNVQSGMDNPQGYRFVEFPIYNALQAGLSGGLGRLGGLGITLDQWGRLISIFATLGGALFVFLLTKKYAGKLVGFFALFFYLFLPFSIFYGRTILPDPAMTASIMGGIYFFDRWIENSSSVSRHSGERSQIPSGIWRSDSRISNHQRDSGQDGYQTVTRQARMTIRMAYLFYILSIVFTASALLLKPFAIFFTLPITYLAFREFGFAIIKKWQVWLFAVLTIAPLLAWRWWIGLYPEGIPASDWLFNGNGIRFRPAFFRWIFFERITRLILGYAGVVFLVIGGIRAIGENNPSLPSTSLRVASPGFFLSFVVSSFLYVIVIATGNVQHDYYQIAIIPTISIFGGLGVLGVYWILKKANAVLAAIGVSVLIAVSLLLSWLQVRDYFNINDRGMVEAAEAANRILPQDATIIAPYDGSTTFLNLIQRRGWPVFQNPIEEIIDKGAEYLVIANPTKSDYDGFGRAYDPIASSASYLILKLR